MRATRRGARPRLSARLVVADDAAAVRALLGAALAAYTVLPAARGDDALALIRRERPDLAVLDVQMPGLDGLAVARALAADPATAAVPVVRCSGAGPAAPPPPRPQGAVVAFLPKPFDLGELLGTVARTLRRPPPSADPPGRGQPVWVG
jgi:CheY-like chemotaxis protein